MPPSNKKHSAKRKSRGKKGGGKHAVHAAVMAKPATTVEQDSPLRYPVGDRITVTYTLNKVITHLMMRWTTDVNNDGKRGEDEPQDETSTNNNSTLTLVIESLYKGTTLLQWLFTPANLGNDWRGVLTIESKKLGKREYVEQATDGTPIHHQFLFIYGT